MSTVLWDEAEIKTFIKERGGDPEVVFKNPALTSYWLKKYDTHYRRRRIATKPAEELLDWIYQTILEASEEELADTALEIFAILRLRKAGALR